MNRWLNVLALLAMIVVCGISWWHRRGPMDDSMPGKLAQQPPVRLQETPLAEET